jgi:hypothetical protein
LIGKTEELRKKLVPLPLCPPQIPHGFILTWTRASTVRGRQLTAWTMAQPMMVLLFIEKLFCSLLHIVISFPTSNSFIKHVDWLWRGETMSQNCSHQWAYCSSPGWYVSLESLGDDDDDDASWE